MGHLKNFRTYSACLCEAFFAEAISPLTHEERDCRVAKCTLLPKEPGLCRKDIVKVAALAESTLVCKDSFNTF